MLVDVVFFLARSLIFGVLSGFGCAIQKLKTRTKRYQQRNNKFRHSQRDTEYITKRARSRQPARSLALLSTIRKSKPAISNVTDCLLLLLATVIVQKYVTYTKLLCDQNWRVALTLTHINLSSMCIIHRSPNSLCTCNKRQHTAFWNNIFVYSICYNLVYIRHSQATDCLAFLPKMPHIFEMRIIGMALNVFKPSHKVLFIALVLHISNN